jgi:hypothetical protein
LHLLTSFVKIRVLRGSRNASLQRISEDRASNTRAENPKG